MSFQDSEVTRVKKLGSSKSGLHHWIVQRLSAIALVPLTCWFVIIILKLYSANSVETISILTSPFNTVLLVLFIIMIMYHGMLGMKVIIEDYIHSTCWRNFWIILLYGITILTIFSGVSAVLIAYVIVYT